jgi:hypothetical protein
MKIYKGKLNKAKLLQISEAERKLFIAIAHLQNEIRFSLYGVVWSHDFSSNNDAVVQGQISLNFFYLKILAGKLHEGWQLLQKYYFTNKVLSTDFSANGSKEAVDLLKSLGKYFGRTNLISEIRNNLSFHYSPDDLDNQLENLPEDLELYIAKENDANTLYYFAEALANRGVLAKLNYDDNFNPFEAIYSELITIAKKFNKFNMLYMKYLIRKYSPEIWDGAAEEIELKGLVKFLDVRIPLFTDTMDGFI